MPISSCGRSAALSAILSFFFAFASLAQVGTPVARIEAFLTAVERIETPAWRNHELDDAQRRVNAAAFVRLDDYFDYERLALDALGGFRGRFSPEQLQRYLLRFRQVIRLVAFPACADALRNAQLRVEGGATSDQRADVNVLVHDLRTQADTAIVFHVHENQERWRLYDVSVAGHSLAVDYREQFARILQHNPSEVLLARLDERLRAEQQRHLVVE